MYSCIAMRERVVEVAEPFPHYCPPTSLNGFQCLVGARWRNGPFLHLPLNAHARFPPNKEGFGIEGVDDDEERKAKVVGDMDEFDMIIMVVVNGVYK